MVTNKLLDRWPTYINCSVLENKQMSAFINQKGRWDHETLEDGFGGDLLEMILSIEIRPELEEDMPKLYKMPLGKAITVITYVGLFPTIENQFLWLKKPFLRPRERIFWWRSQPMCG